MKHIPIGGTTCYDYHCIDCDHSFDRNSGHCPICGKDRIASNKNDERKPNKTVKESAETIRRLIKLGAFIKLAQPPGRGFRNAGIGGAQPDETAGGKGISNFVAPAATGNDHLPTIPSLGGQPGSRNAFGRALDTDLGRVEIPPAGVSRTQNLGGSPTYFNYSQFSRGSVGTSGVDPTRPDEVNPKSPDALPVAGGHNVTVGDAANLIPASRVAGVGARLVGAGSRGANLAERATNAAGAYNAFATGHNWVMDQGGSGQQPAQVAQAGAGPTTLPGQAAPPPAMNPVPQPSPDLAMGQAPTSVAQAPPPAPAPMPKPDWQSQWA